MVSTKIETFLARIFASMNAGLEARQSRRVRAEGWGGGDQAKGQSEAGEDGSEAYFF